MKAKPHPCAYAPDPQSPPDHNGDQPCTCGLPKRNARHQLPPAPPAQEEHRARVGDRDR